MGERKESDLMKHQKAAVLREPDPELRIPLPTRAMAKARFMALAYYYPRTKWEERPWGDRKAWLAHEAKMREALRSLGYVVVRVRSRSRKKKGARP
jgi:hypothetical protein